MEFLINIKINWPAGMDAAVKEKISHEERAHAAELAKKGHLVRMWRVVGRRENWGLWRAKDATEMHAIISSLPVWPYMDVSATALARHPVDPNPPEPGRTAS